MIALPPPSRGFDCPIFVFSRRLHDFFTIEELSCPFVQVVDVA